MNVPRDKGGRLAAIHWSMTRSPPFRLHRSRRFRTRVHPEREQGDSGRRAEGEERAVHPFSDSALLRDMDPTRGWRPRGHPGSVRTYRRRDDAHLLHADTRQAARRDPAAYGPRLHGDDIPRIRRDCQGTTMGARGRGLGARGETPRGTESGEAPAWQGATREHIGHIRPRNNDVHEGRIAA